MEWWVREEERIGGGGNSERGGRSVGGRKATKG